MQHVCQLWQTFENKFIVRIHFSSNLSNPVMFFWLMFLFNWNNISIKNKKKVVMIFFFIKKSIFFEYIIF